jgi:hypothetical protein
VFYDTMVTLPVTVRVPVPLIVDVPALAVVMEAKVFAASIFKVPPALIIMALFTGIVLALTVFGEVIVVVCPKAPLTKNKPAIINAKIFDLSNNIFMVVLLVGNAEGVYMLYWLASMPLFLSLEKSFLNNPANRDDVNEFVKLLTWFVAERKNVFIKAVVFKLFFCINENDPALAESSL